MSEVVNEQLNTGTPVDESMATLQLIGLSSQDRERLKQSSELRLLHEQANTLELVALYTRASRNRSQFLKEYDTIREFYLVEALLNAIADDALTPDATTGEVLELYSEDKDLNDKLKTLQEEFDFDQIVNDIIMDLLAHGEHTLALKVEEGKGILSIDDNVDQKRLFAFYKHGYPKMYVTQGDHDLKAHPPHEFAHFVIGQYKLRIEIEEEMQKRIDRKKVSVEDLPSYIRVGRPLLYGVLSKIKELILVEQLVPASKLSQILAGTIVGVNVPPSTSPEDGFNISRKFENLLNAKVGISKVTGDISIADIMAVAGKLKVIPVFGDKGDMRPIDVRENRAVDDLINSIRDTREVICTSIGFPFEMLFGGEGKSDYLKRYARYLRKLKALQTSIAQGLRQIAMIHLVNMDGGKEVSPKDIQVKFKNELIAIDELEKLEFNDAVISSIDQVMRMADSIRQEDDLKSIITPEGIHAWLTQMTKIVPNLQLLLKGGKVTKPNPDDDVDTDNPSSLLKGIRGFDGDDVDSTEPEKEENKEGELFDGIR